MNPNNRVRLIGSLTRDPKSGRGQKAAWAFASVAPDGGKSRIDIKAFKAPAETLAELGQGSKVRIEGHLESQKGREEGAKWQLVVVADEVHVNEKVERGAAGSAGDDLGGSEPAGTGSEMD